MKIIHESPDYQFIETVHSKKGTPLFVLQLKNQVEDKFKLVSRRVDKRGGYYSGHQKGFVFYRELEKKELDEIFKNIFFVEEEKEELFDVKDDAWKHTLAELRTLPYKQREDGSYAFKYYIDGEPKIYTIKVPSEEYEDAVAMFTRFIVGAALSDKKYNHAVSDGTMKPEKAAAIIKSSGMSLMEVEEDYGDLHENIRAVWNIKSSTKKQVHDKIQHPYLFERDELSHLSDKRYAEIIFKALSDGVYAKMVNNDELSANKAAFIIESAGFEIPEEILSLAIIEKQQEVESLVGGYADGKTIFDISQKHNVPIVEIIKQFKKGARVEREHTKGKRRIGEIVKDHLYEYPYYYEALKKTEEALGDLDASKYKTHEEYMQAYDENMKFRSEYGDEQIAILKSRTLIDKIRLADKDLSTDIPEEVAEFYKNRVLNWFVKMFERAVVDYVPMATTWLEYQREYLPKELYGGMFFYGLLNKSFIKPEAAKSFIDNVISSEMYYGTLPLNNLLNVIPDTFCNQTPSELEYVVHPKDNGLKELLNPFVKRGCFASALMGVYFSKKGAFASTVGMDIFVRAKAGYLKRNDLEEGVYGMSENSKDYFPVYGKGRFPMYKMKSGVDFMQRYMALYSNVKYKNPTLFTNDELIDLYKSLTKIYNAKAYKEFYKVDVIDRNPLNPLSGKMVKRRYPLFYVTKSDKLFTFSLVEFIKCVEAAIKMGMDVSQISITSDGMMISENIEGFLSFSESGVKLSVRDDEKVVPHGAIYYNLDKKSFFTNKIGEAEEDKGDLHDIEILEARLSILKRMFKKKKDDYLSVRIKVVEKMIKKLKTK